MTSALRGQACGSSKVKVTILASEWGSSNGGLSTINRELAIQLAKLPDVEIAFFLPKCSEQDKKEALGHKINIVEAKRRPGYGELEWLSFPPDHLQIDVIVGHGVKLGRQAQVIRDSHKCKWVQVVHTDPEELGMFKCYSNPISKGEEKHKVEVELCEMANCVIGVGPKLSEAFRSYLRGCQKDRTVHNFTPGVFDEFVSVQQVSEEREHFCILVFGRGDAEDFEVKGFDVAAKAVASLNDSRLIFVGAPDGKNYEIKKRLLDCGISASRLRVRGYVESRKSLKDLFCEVDMVLMPSRTEGFGLTGLEALSAGLPVLVSKNSGFGEALSKVRFGSSSVIDSEDPKVWAEGIKHIWGKDRQSRLGEAEALRSYYNEKYSWAKQSKDLFERMIIMVHESSSSCQSSSHSASELFSSSGQISQRIDVTAASRLPLRLDCETVPHVFDTQQVLNLIAMSYLQTVQPSTAEDYNKFKSYLEEMKQVLIVGVGTGSLIITLECSSLEILEGLWEDYCSGHLNEMAQKYLVTEDILQESGLLEVKLITTILEVDYRICREFFSGKELDKASKMNADFASYLQKMISSLKNTIQHLRTAANYLDKVWNIDRSQAALISGGFGVAFATAVAVAAGSVSGATVVLSAVGANVATGGGFGAATVAAGAAGAAAGAAAVAVASCGVLGAVAVAAGAVAVAAAAVAAAGVFDAAAAPLKGGFKSASRVAADVMAKKVNSAIQSDEIKKVNDTVENTKLVLNDVRKRIPDVQDQKFLVGQIVMELDNIQKAINELLENTFTVESQSGTIVFNVIQVIKDMESKAAQCFRDKAEEIEEVLQRYTSSV